MSKITKHLCNYCYKEYSRKDLLKRHQLTACKVLKNQRAGKADIIEEGNLVDNKASHIESAIEENDVEVEKQPSEEDSSMGEEEEPGMEIPENYNVRTHGLLPDNSSSSSSKSSSSSNSPLKTCSYLRKEGGNIFSDHQEDSHKKVKWHIFQDDDPSESEHNSTEGEEAYSTTTTQDSTEECSSQDQLELESEDASTENHHTPTGSQTDNGYSLGIAKICTCCKAIY